MKKCFFITLMVIGAVLANAQQNLWIEPQKPQAGSVFNIKFNPKNTTLAAASQFEANAYLFDGSEFPVVQPVTLKKEGEAYVGKVKTSEGTRAVFFSFYNDEIKENNKDEGYYTALYDKKGVEVPGAQLAIGSAFARLGGIWGLKTDRQKGTDHSRKEFASAASRARFYNEYYTYLAQSSDPADKELLKTELKKHLAKKDLKESDLEKVKGFYTQLKDKEQADAVAAQIKQRYPEGNWKKMELIAAINKEKNLAEKVRMFDQLNSTYTFSKEEFGIYDRTLNSIAMKFADTGDLKQMFHYAGMMKDRINELFLYSSIARKMAGQGVYGKPVDVTTGKQLAEKSLEMIQQEIKSPSNIPSYVTAKEMGKNLNSYYYMFADIYATLLYHNGEYEKAYELQKKVVDHSKGMNMNSNETFAVIAEKAKGPGEALKALEGFFAEGKYTPKMKEQFQRLYVGSGKTEEQWTRFAGELETVAFNKLKAELMKKMINEPAPDFKLKDLNGKEVALASLKGKTVVVDFWATWCGPCIASFPGMQKAVNKYKNNPDVVFLFIDTWETGDDREKKVKSFLEKNEYNFLVLYDETKKSNADEFTVVSDFKVQGIPTKFVVDKNNNIRFKSVGYHGSEEGLINEITAMIELASTESGNMQGAKKAF